MNRLPLLLTLACFLTGHTPISGADSKYHELAKGDDGVPRLQTDPLPISAYKTLLDVAFATESMRLRAVGDDGQVRQWGVDSLAQAREIAIPETRPVCAALSSNSEWLASADDDGGVSVTELQGGKRLFRDETLSENTVALKFSDDATRIAGVAETGLVRVWDTQTGKVVDRFHVAPGSVHSLSFSASGNRVAVSSFGTEVAVYDLNTGAPRSTISVGRSRVTATAWTRAGDQVVVATADGTMFLADPERSQNLRILANHPFAVWTMATDDLGRLAAGSWDGTIRIWETESWKMLQSVKAHGESVCALLLHPQGMVSAGMDGRLLYWPTGLPSKRQLGMIDGPVNPLWVTAFSPDGTQLYVGGGGQRSERWDWDAKKLLGSGPAHPTVRCAAFSPDGTLFATGGDDRTVVIASSPEGEIHHRLVGHPGLVSAVLFVDRGQTLISGCDAGLLKFWDVRSGEEIASRKRHRQQLYCAAVSPDQKWLVTGGGHWAKGDPGELMVWDLPRRMFVKSLTGHSLTVWSIVFAPDGGYFATSDSAGEVKIWDTETLRLRRTLKHQTWLRPLAMAPNGDLLAVGRGDGSIRLWDTKTWKQTAVCDGHDSFTFWLSFAPDGETLASAGNDGTTRLWQIE